MKIQLAAMLFFKEAYPILDEVETSDGQKVELLTKRIQELYEKVHL